MYMFQNIYIFFIGVYSEIRRVKMVNLMSFLSSFASYLVVYVVFITAIIIAFSIGFAVRKNKNKSEAVLETEADTAQSK